MPYLVCLNWHLHAGKEFSPLWRVKKSNGLYGGSQMEILHNCEGAKVMLFLKPDMIREI